MRTSALTPAYELSEQEEDQLYSYYGLSGHVGGAADEYGAGRGTGTTTGTTTDDDTRSRAQGYDTSGPTTDEAMTRSEERVRTGTEQVQAGKARLRKYVTTEQQQISVPVTREEVRVEREPITDTNRDAALSGPDFTEAEHEVTLTPKSVPSRPPRPSRSNASASPRTRSKTSRPSPRMSARSRSRPKRTPARD